MPPNQAILSKKFEELESELHLFKHLKQHHHLLPSIRSKLTFLTSLQAAEPIFSSPELSTRLSHIASQISSFDQPNSQPKIPPLSPEEEGEKETSVAARIAAVEEVFARLVSTDDTPPSCSRTTSSSSCHTEEVEEEEEVVGSRAPWLLSLRSKIEDLEQEINGDGYDDAQRKIRFFKSLLAAEMKWKGGEKVNDFDSFVKRFSSIESEFAGRNAESFTCSCTSSCFDEVREKEKVGEVEEEDGSVSGVNEIGECCLLESVEVVGVDLESDDSEKGIGGGRRFGKLGALGAMVGVLAVAAAGVVIGSLYGEINHVYLVPT